MLYFALFLLCSASLSSIVSGAIQTSYMYCDSVIVIGRSANPIPSCEDYAHQRQTKLYKTSLVIVMTRVHGSITVQWLC